MSRRPRLLYVAPRPALPTTSGQIVMHRHLGALGDAFEITSVYYATEAGATSLPPLKRSRLYTWLQGSRFHRWSEALNAVFPFAITSRQLRPFVAQADLVVVIAESPVFAPAVAAARRRGVPIVAIVHDWSPVWLDVPNRLRSLVDERFRATCQECTVTLSVSQELADALGGGTRHRLLYPVPAATGPAEASAAVSAPAAFSAVYAGMFHYFQAGEVAGLCEELIRRNRPELLRLYGPPPDWSAAYAQPVRRGNFHAGFVAQAELAARLASAGALLVICPFAPHLAAFAKYSFPSKLTEYCRFGRPIVLWGPEHAAAVRWAQQSGSVVVVTDPDPAAVVEALLELERQPARRQQFGEAARAAAETTFSPARLQGVFESALREALGQSAAAH